MAKHGRESDASYGVTPRTPPGRAWGAVMTSPSKQSLSPCWRCYFWERCSLRLVFPLPSPAIGVLAPGLQLSHFLPGLNFAIWRVPAQWWQPDAKMSLCHLVLPPCQATGSPDQRSPAALSVSSARLAQPPKPSGRGGFDGTFFDEERGSR